MSDLVKCQYCGKEYKEKGIHVHEAQCKMNPDNIVHEEPKKDETPEVQVMTENELKKDLNTMKAKIQSCPKKDIFVFPDEAYPKGSKRMVAVNGVVYSIPVGIHFTGENGVPEPIYDAYMDSYTRTEEAKGKMEKQLKKEIITIQ